MRAAVIFVASALLLIGCAYKAGALAKAKPEEGFTGRYATVGCLDIAIDRKADRGSSAVLGFEVGNRCDDKVVIDLAFAHVIGRTADGVEVALAADDPELLQPLALDGRAVGEEAVAYASRDQLGQVCVDVASLANEKPAQWMCFGNTESVALLVP